MTKKYLKTLSNPAIEKPLISIIVPIYNVEKYLEKCVLSIIDQTYTNLEIILINDGSTDNSSKLCKELALLDQRIIVIHKMNGGLSDARNVGINRATGLYISFVDSDDYISTDMIETLLTSIIENKCEISTCRYQTYTEDSPIHPRSTQSNNFLVLNNTQALEDMLYLRNLTNSAWGKLYKTELFRSIRYPAGHTYEDLATTYKLFSKAENIVLNSFEGYYYLKRSGSITNSKFTQSRMSGSDFAHEQLMYVAENHPQILKAAENRLFTESRYILSAINTTDKKSTISRNKCIEIITKYRRTILFDRKSSIVNRTFAAISYISIKLMLKIIAIKAKRDWNNNV